MLDNADIATLQAYPIKTELGGGFRGVFASLDNADIASAKFWMQHCDAPRRLDAGSPVYDATLWHIIVPEMLRSVSAASPPVCGACGQPWNGYVCGQKDNGWPFQTCFPLVPNNSTEGEK